MKTKRRYIAMIIFLSFIIFFQLETLAASHPPPFSRGRTLVGKTPDKRTGSIVGIVRERSTQQPLGGVHILVVGARRSVTTNRHGQFSMTFVPVGTYQLKAFLIGYGPLVKTDVVVSTGHDANVVIELDQTIYQLEGVTVQAHIFHKHPAISTSAHTLSREAIRRAPGGIEDVNRVMMSMPGVASQDDGSNNLIVRGGNPIENLTVFEHIEIPNSNHFGDQGETGGAIGMINVDFIQEANFYTGGFPAIYGDKLSSVLDIRLREGNRQQIASDLSLNMAGVGGVFEGPIDSGNGSWLLSYRKSFLDLIKGPVGLTAVPQYSDVQGKLVYDVTSKDQLSLVGIGGIDRINITDNDDNYSEGNDWILFEPKQYGVGLNWWSLLSERGFSIVTLSQAYNKHLGDVRESNGSQVFLNQSWERETTLKGELNYDFNPDNHLITGLSARLVTFRHNVWSKDREFYSDEAGDVITLPGRRTDEQIDTYKAGAFLHYTLSPIKRLRLKGGVRADYFDYTQAFDVSPRFGASYNFTPDTTFNASFGFFYQTPPYVWLTLNERNRNLKNMHAKHAVLGVEHLFRNGLRFTIEAYNKDYSDYPTGQSDANRVLVNEANGYARGVDVFLQQPLTEHLHGLVSYSHSRARAKTPRHGEFDWDYDYQHVLTLIAGYRADDRWEFSGRWRYMGGRPYTPVIESFELSPGDWEPIYDEAHPNSKRLPAYHRLDLRFDRRFHFSNWNLVTFFEVQNVYNRKNIWGLRWDREDRETVEIHQFSFFPIGGFRVEF